MSNLREWLPEGNETEEGKRVFQVMCDFLVVRSKYGIS